MHPSAQVENKVHDLHKPRGPRSNKITVAPLSHATGASAGSPRDRRRESLSEAEASHIADTNVEF